MTKWLRSKVFSANPVFTVTNSGCCFFLCLSLISSGCSDLASDFDAQTCTEFVVPSGFGMGWSRLNHRISDWKIRPSHEGCRAKNLFVRHVGGNFSTGDAFTVSDRPDVFFSYQSVVTAPEQVGVARVTVNTIVGPTGVSEGSAIFSLQALKLTGYDAFETVIEGISFDTAVTQTTDYPSDYNPAHGYTMRGIGARVDVEQSGTDDLRLSYLSRFQPGASLDRNALNQTLEHAQVAARIDVMIIGVGSARTYRQPVAYAIDYERPEPVKDQPLVEPNSDETILGVAVRESSFSGFAAFDYSFDLTNRCDDGLQCPAGDQCTDGVCEGLVGPAGEYLRRIEFSVVRDESGQLRVRGIASNASKVIAYYDLDYRFSAEIVTVEVNDLIVRTNAIRSDFATGSTTFPIE